MRNLVLITAISISLYSCGNSASKSTEDTAKTVKEDSVKPDTLIKEGTAVTSSTTTTSITVDPSTNDSTIITKTVIKHRYKK